LADRAIHALARCVVEGCELSWWRPYLYAWVSISRRCSVRSPAANAA